MTKQKYIDWNPRPAALAMIAKMNDVLDDYHAQGYVLTLRQLYYQLVQKNIIENSILSYKRIGETVSNARKAGLMDWAMIEDRGRSVVANAHWDSPAQIVKAAAQQFTIDHWTGQKHYCHCMVEKDALSGVLEPVCSELDIRFSANKGYTSDTAMRNIGQRILLEKQSNKAVKYFHPFYFGDHDPSGLDMTRDVGERLAMFAEMENDKKLIIHRLALNFDQIADWQPPKNPAKETDSRFEKYMLEFGESSWELDAVSPATLGDLLRKEVNALIDRDVWNKVIAKEAQMRGELLAFADTYGKKKGNG